MRRVRRAVKRTIEELKAITDAIKALANYVKGASSRNSIKA
ncbi:hypothetical protein [Vulcanisaeta sp. JCM 16159]